MVLSRSARFRLLLRGLALGFLAAALSLMLGAAGVLAPLERGASNALFRLRGPRAAGSRVVLLVVDEATVRAAKRQPLPRGYYARALEKLHAAGARVVAFNFAFGSPSDDPREDALLARASARGNVVQAAIFDVPFAARGEGQSQADLARLSRSSLRDEGAGARLGLSIWAPLPALLTSNASIGHLNLHPDDDGSFSRIPHLIRFDQRLYPSLALAAAMRAQGWQPQAMAASGGGIAVPPTGAARQIPLDENGQSLINWCGGDGTFATVSLLKLLNGQVPPRVWRGATVFIGNNLPGNFLPISTPFSRNQTTLHLQANAFDDIVSGRVLRPPGAGAAGLLLLVCSLGAGALIAPRGAAGALGWTLGGSVALWGAALAALLFNFSMAVAVPQIALLLTGVACVGVRQAREGRELRLLHEVFAGYVGDDLLRTIKGRKIKLDGEVRHITVLFCDIRGFSGLAERMKDDPEALLRLLNDHFNPIVETLKAHGAYVDNYIGDEVMAIFGAPVSQHSGDRNTRSAVMAARQVQRLVALRNRERAALGEAAIHIGMGVHCGPAVVGDLGTSRKKHYTAIGDTVNIASRVERETRTFEREFLVTESVVQVCRDHPDTDGIEWSFVAETPVKGRSGQLRLYST